MSMEEHLDYMSHPNDWPKVFPEVGTIKGVRAKDYSTNITGGAFTTYDVTVHFQAGYGCQNIDLEHVPPAGQFAGGAIEVEFDYVVGQKVIVGFLGGDLNRPYIQSPYLDLDTTNARTTAQYPRIRILANGAEILVDKDGNISLVPKSGEELTLAGLVGDAGLKKLVTETVQPLIEDHYHYVAVIGPSTKALNPALATPPVSPPSPPAGAALLDLTPALTSTTKAK